MKQKQIPNEPKQVLKQILPFHTNYFNKFKHTQLIIMSAIFSAINTFIFNNFNNHMKMYSLQIHLQSIYQLIFTNFSRVLPQIFISHMGPFQRSLHPSHLHLSKSFAKPCPNQTVNYKLSKEADFIIISKPYS